MVRALLVADLPGAGFVLLAGSCCKLGSGAERRVWVKMMEEHIRCQLSGLHHHQKPPSI